MRNEYFSFTQCSKANFSSNGTSKLQGYFRQRNEFQIHIFKMVDRGCFSFNTKTWRFAGNRRSRQVCISKVSMNSRVSVKYFLYIHQNFFFISAKIPQIKKKLKENGYMGQKDKCVNLPATVTAFSRSVKYLSSLDLRVNLKTENWQ